MKMDAREKESKLKLKFQAMINRVARMAIVIFLFSGLPSLQAQDILVNSYRPLVIEYNSVGLLYLKIDVFAIPFPSRSHERFLYLRFNDYELFNRNFIKQEQASVPINHEIFNALYNKPMVDEKKRLREEWKKAFGIDVWYPYYEFKKVEKWVKKRFSVKIFRLKGEPEFARNQILYTLKTKF